MEKNRKYLGSFSFDNYIRQIELSKAQRPKYWEWNGETIKCGSKKLLQKFINPIKKDSIIYNNGNILPSYLRPEYTICCFKGTQLYGELDKQTLEILTLPNVKLTKTNSKKPIKYFLCYGFNSVKIIANPTKVGKPKLHIISGQDFHVGLNPFIRTKVVDELHKFYYDGFKAKSLYLDLTRFKQILANSYPLHIELEIKDTVKNCFDNTKKGNGKRWDVGNRALPYMKTFLDFLSNGYKEFEPFITDDDRLHISSGNNSFFTPIEENHTPLLIFHFYKDNNELFKKYLDAENKKRI